MGNVITAAATDRATAGTVGTVGNGFLLLVAVSLHNTVGR